LKWIVILILSLSLAACLGETEAPSPAVEQSEPTGNPTYIQIVEVEEHTGESVEELTEEELVQAMKDLGIQSIDLTDEDKAALAAEQNKAEVDGATVTYERQPGGAAEVSYLDELERLAALRDQGAITEEEFAAKKGQLLGL
jgi:hypothetical protein